MLVRVRLDQAGRVQLIYHVLNLGSANMFTESMMLVHPMFIGPVVNLTSLLASTCICFITSNMRTQKYKVIPKVVTTSSTK